MVAGRGIPARPPHWIGQRGDDANPGGYAATAALYVRHRGQKSKVPAEKALAKFSAAKRKLHLLDIGESVDL